MAVQSETVESWDASESKLLDPEQELETIELGNRVGWFITLWQGVFCYREEDRQRAATLELVGEVAEATSWKGLRFPPKWWPADAGPYKDIRRGQESAGLDKNES